MPPSRVSATSRSRRLVPVILASGVCGAFRMAIGGVDGVPGPVLTVLTLALFTVGFIGYAAHTTLRGVEPAEQARVVGALGLLALGLFFGDPLAQAFGAAAAAVSGLLILAVAVAWATHELHADQ